MKRLGKFSISFLAAVAAVSLAACGGGGSRSALPQAILSNGTADYTGPLSDTTFKITIPPPPKTSSNLRRPSYVSSSTSKIVFTLNTASRLNTSQVTSFNTSSLGTFAVTLNSAKCPGSGPWTCTLTVKLPPGSDNLTISAQDSSSHILSQQIQTFTVTVGGSGGTGNANNFSTTLDANVGTLIVSGNGSCESGPVGSAFGSVGTSPVNFTIATKDLAGQTIFAPGQATIEIQDENATYQSSSGTIQGAGGTVTFTITQSAQTFTLTPSNSTTTNASVNVKVVPANSNGGSDGLGAGFPAVKTFTFSTGTAPPTHQFLAAVEQTGVGSGKVDFFNLTTDAGGPNGFATGMAAFSPASLAVTASTNDATQNDVDNPVNLAWDNTGDLLIGNGGSSGNGNLACVPVGAIATGANSSTTVTANIHDPVGLAYESRNGTVAVNNNANSGTPPLAQYVLTGNYTASTTAGSTSLHASNGTVGGELVNMPSLAAGTFAATLTDGCEVDPAHKSCGSAGTSQVVLFNNSGISTTMADASTFHIDEPFGITWDNVNSQLIVANFGAWHPSVVFYTTAGTFVKTDSHDYFDDYQNPYLVAANGAGLFAVAYTTAIAGDQVQIYTNAMNGTAPTPLFNAIPFDAENNNSCSGGYVYGSSAVVNGLVWLSNTRLLVSLQSNLASAQGLYIFDTASSTTPTQWTDGNVAAGCQPVGTIPAQKAFQLFSNKPFAAAYKS